MDYIHVNEMEFWGYHGVFAEETKLGQRFRVTLITCCRFAGSGANGQSRENG